jgi:hypothetical protein
MAAALTQPTPAGQRPRSVPAALLSQPMRVTEQPQPQPHEQSQPTRQPQPTLPVEAAPIGPATPDRWPSLPDDTPLWLPAPAAAVTSDRVRLDDEQRGLPWNG